MYALTLIQPWASLVAIGAKRIETRSWKTDYRGRIAIHAAKAFPKHAQIACYYDPFATVLREAGLASIEYPEGQDAAKWVHTMPKGAILATAQLVECVPITTIQRMRDNLSIQHLLTDQEIAFGNYSENEGRWAWVLRDVRKLFYPITAKGALGLWTLDERTEAEVLLMEETAQALALAKTQSTELFYADDEDRAEGDDETEQEYQDRVALHEAICGKA